MSDLINKSNTSVASAYKQALHLDPRQLASELVKELGGTLVSALAGAKDTKAAHKWARKDGVVPREEAEKRLRFAHEQWNRISDAEGDHVTRAWFIGANPWLEYDTPVQAIREGRFREVVAATEALLNESYSG